MLSLLSQKINSLCQYNVIRTLVTNLQYVYYITNACLFIQGLFMLNYHIGHHIFLSRADQCPCLDICIFWLATQIKVRCRVRVRRKKNGGTQFKIVTQCYCQLKCCTISSLLYICGNIVMYKHCILCLPNLDETEQVCFTSTIHLCLPGQFLHSQGNVHHESASALHISTQPLYSICLSIYCTYLLCLLITLFP